MLTAKPQWKIWLSGKSILKNFEVDIASIRKRMSIFGKISANLLHFYCIGL